MGFQGGERAVSEVMGAILVFGILVTALGVYQAVVVPDVNEEVEFKHNAEVRGDMQDLWTAMIETGRTGERNTVQLTTGADYPTRVFTVNPPPISGRLTTSETQGAAITLSGATATKSEAADFWDGSEREFDTRFVEYVPEYNYYNNAPTTTFEPTVLFSEDRGGTVVDSPQRLVDGHTVNLVLVDGQYAKSTDRTLSLDTVPISASAHTVEIETTADSDPIRLTVKTRLPEKSWRDHAAKYAHVSIPPDGYDDTVSPNEVTIELSAAEYTLNIAKVGVNQDDSLSPAYIENTDALERTINPGETTQIRTRVLDQYGNPREDVTVRSDFAGDAVTDENGVATFEYGSTSSGPHHLHVWFGAASYAASPEEKRIEYDVTVSEPSTSEVGSANSNLINPGSGLVLRSSTVESGNSVDMEFENTGESEWENVSEVRLNYYFVGPPGSGGSIASRCYPDEGIGSRVPQTMVIGESFEQTDGTFNVSNSDGRVGFSVEFDSTDSCSGGFSIEETDYFIMTLIFEDGTARIYFVAPG